MFAKVLVLASVLAANPAATWRSDGGATIVASYVRIDDEKVYLRRNDNGIVVGVPFERLDRDSLVMALRMAAAAPKVAGKGEPAGKATPAVAKGAPMTVDEVVEFLRGRKMGGTSLVQKRQTDEAARDFVATAKARGLTVRASVLDTERYLSKTYRARVIPVFDEFQVVKHEQFVTMSKDVAESLDAGDVLVIHGTPIIVPSGVAVEDERSLFHIGSVNYMTVFADDSWKLSDPRGPWFQIYLSGISFVVERK